MINQTSTACPVCLEHGDDAGPHVYWPCAHCVHATCLLRSPRMINGPRAVCRHPSNLRLQNCTLAGSEATPGTDLGRSASDPIPPPKVVPLCCRRVVFNGHEFEVIQDSRMEWSPIEAEPLWLCSSCGASVSQWPQLEAPFICTVHGEAGIVFRNQGAVWYQCLADDGTRTKLLVSGCPFPKLMPSPTSMIWLITRCGRGGHI